MQHSDFIALVEVAKEILCEQLNLHTKLTGLPLSVYVSQKFQNSVEVNHGPRIKVSMTPGTFDPNNCFSASISKTPEIVAGTPDKKSAKHVDAIKDWIVVNHDTLLDYWNCNKDIHVVKHELKKI